MAVPFTVSVQARGDDTVVLRAAGELDGATRHVLLAKTATVLSTFPARIELDLADVRFIDCMGLGALVSLRNNADGHDRVLVVTASSPAVARLMDLTGLGDHLGTARVPTLANAGCTPSSATETT